VGLERSPLSLVSTIEDQSVLMAQAVQEGREDVQVDPRNGQSTTQRTGANEHRVGTFVRSDRRLSVRAIAEELNIGIGLERGAQTVGSQVTKTMGLHIMH
jgi:hypothetical protein